MIRKSRTIKVKSNKYVTPNMKRIVFEGSDIQQFSSDYNGAYVKLVVPVESKGFFSKTKVRPYTIRSIDNVTKELTMDFAIHKPAGPATNWALNAAVGDEISFMGPGPKKFQTSIEGWYLFAADMSAMPAAIAAIEELPKNSIGEVFFEIISKEDVQEFDKPAGVNIHWLIHKENSDNEQLEEIQKLEIPDLANVFVAGEIDTVKQIKQYLLNDTKVKNANNVYISSYWKIGKTEEEHKRAKMKL